MYLFLLMPFTICSSFGCGNDDDRSRTPTDRDLTTEILGTYEDMLILSDSLEFLSEIISSSVISKISNSEIEIFLVTSSIENTVFNATMTSQTEFTIPSFSSSSSVSYSGSGRFQDGILTIELMSSDGEAQLITNDLTILFFPGNYLGEYTLRSAPGEEPEVFEGVGARVIKRSNKEIAIEILNEPIAQEAIELRATIVTDVPTDGTQYTLEPISIAGESFTGFGFINRFTFPAESLILTLTSEEDNEIRQYMGQRQ